MEIALQRISQWDELAIRLLQNPSPYPLAFTRHLSRDGWGILPSPPTLPQRSPVDHAIDEVRDNLYWLRAAFADKSARIAAAIVVKEALRELEGTARRYEWEDLTFVAAILHDTLRYNPIEAFDERQCRAFLEASRQVIDVAPSDSDPTTCLQALWRGGLDWLPPVNALCEDSDMEDYEDEEDEEVEE